MFRPHCAGSYVPRLTIIMLLVQDHEVKGTYVAIYGTLVAGV
jgi:hypothetical protein